MRSYFRPAVAGVGQAFLCMLEESEVPILIVSQHLLAPLLPLPTGLNFSYQVQRIAVFRALRAQISPIGLRDMAKNGPKFLLFPDIHYT